MAQKKFKMPIFKIGKYQSNLYYDDDFPEGVSPFDYNKFKHEAGDFEYSHYNIAYSKTISGVISSMYHQKNFKAKKTGTKLDYDFSWWVTWCIEQDRFDELFFLWIYSGYHTDFKPSLGRFDTKDGYTKSNIQLMPWKENKNSTKGGKISGKSANAYKAVNMLDTDGKFMKNFISLAQAEKWLRSNGFPNAENQNIRQCCKGKLNKAYNHKWEYE